IVHHADGTRIFHSFTLLDDLNLGNDNEENKEIVRDFLDKYETSTGIKPPMRAVMCIESPNSPRILIYLVRKGLGTTSGASYAKSTVDLDLYQDQNQQAQVKNQTRGSSEWVRDRVVVVMPDGASIEWSAGTNKIMLSKPDNTHIHYSPSGGVSVFVERLRRRAPPTAGVIGRLPLLYFQTADGTLSVRPSKRAPTVQITGSGNSRLGVALPIIKQPLLQQTQQASGDLKKPINAKHVYYTSMEGIGAWVNAKSLRSATINK
ncbi:MAG: hypothetical protein EZS28_053461, partial [Streblomastix strix]